MERAGSFEGFVSGCVMICTFHSFLFAGAFWFFEKHLYRDYEVKRLHIQYLFAVTFTVCVSMLQLLLLELLHVLNPTLRRLVWHIDLVVVLILLYLILPVALVHTILDPDIDLIAIPGHERTLLALPSSFSQSRRKIVFLIGCSLLLPSLWYIFYKSGGSIMQIEVQGYFFKTMAEHMLACMGVCGVTVVAALAGFGSINYPYRNVTTFLTPVTQAQMAEVERRLIQTLNLIAEKKKKWKMLQRNLYLGDSTVTGGIIGVDTCSFTSFTPSEAYYYNKRNQCWPTPYDSLHSQGPFVSQPGTSTKAYYTIDTDISYTLQEKNQLCDYIEKKCDRSTMRNIGEEIEKSYKNNSLYFSNEYKSNSTEREEFASNVNSCDNSSDNFQHPRLPRYRNIKNERNKLFSHFLSFNDVNNREKDQSLFTISKWIKKIGELREYIWKSISDRQVDKECQIIQTEIKALETLSRELFIGLDELVQSRSRVLFSQTYLGKFHNIIGCCMTAVCMYRVIMSTFNVMLSRVSNTDPATKILQIIFEFLKVPIDVAFWAPYFSLLLMGWIIALNIRGFIEKLLTVFRYLSTSVSSNIFALLMSEIMGLYFSACAILMRTYLPEKYRESVTEVFGSSLDFSAFHLHFDLVFVISCISSFILIFFSHTHRLDKFKSL